MEQDWIPAFFSSVNNYAVMAADRLNADFRLVSQSGWGIVSGWDNNPHTLLPFTKRSAVLPQESRIILRGHILPMIFLPGRRMP